MAAKLIVALMLIAQVFSATEVNPNFITGTLSTPADISYPELVYILYQRHGVPQEPISLSPCARAILGCCKDKLIDESCSEELGCGAFFFDTNPCEDRFVLDAIKAGNRYYQQLIIESRIRRMKMKQNEMKKNEVEKE